jgi:hypothetical protein
LEVSEEICNAIREAGLPDNAKRLEIATTAIAMVASAVNSDIGSEHTDSSLIHLENEIQTWNKALCSASALLLAKGGHLLEASENLLLIGSSRDPNTEFGKFIHGINSGGLTSNARFLDSILQAETSLRRLGCMDDATKLQQTAQCIIEVAQGLSFSINNCDPASTVSKKRNLMGEYIFQLEAIKTVIRKSLCAYLLYSPPCYSGA